MDLIAEPDVYSPSLDSDRNYVDKLSCFAGSKSLRCPCGTRKDKEYTLAQFSAHMKTLGHQRWLADLNLNQTNHYVESIRLQETVNQQKLIIARLEKDVYLKSRTIDILTAQLIKPETPAAPDLLSFD